MRVASSRRSHGAKDWLVINLDSRSFYGFTPHAAHRWYAAQIKKLSSLPKATTTPVNEDMSNSITARIPAELLELILENVDDDDDCIAFGLTCSFFRDVVIEHLRARFKYELVEDPWRGDRVICAGDWNDGDGAHLQTLSTSLGSTRNEIITVTPLDECRCRESRIAEEKLHHSSSSAHVVFLLSGNIERKVHFEVCWRNGLNDFEIGVPRDEGEVSEQGSETFENVSVICIR